MSNLFPITTLPERSDRERACLLLISLYGYGRDVSERSPNMVEKDIATVMGAFSVERNIGAVAMSKSSDRHD